MSNVAELFAEASPATTRSLEQALKVAYLMSRFPKITETFILYEMLAVANHGVQVEIYPLWRDSGKLVHREAAPLVAGAHYEPFWAWRFVAAHLHFLRSTPRTYFAALSALLCGTILSPRYFAGALAMFPKAVYFARQMQKQGIAHVHAHFASHPAAAAFLISRLTGIPYSFTAHGSDLHRDRRMLPEKVAEAAFVVAISNYNRELIVAECGESARDKVEVIHCGVDTEQVGAREPTDAEPSGHELQIVCIGTLHEVKGQVYLIDACRLLQQRGIKVCCHLVGGGPDFRDLKEHVQQSGLENSIRFHGQRSHDQVLELLTKAHVLVAPSVPTRCGRREGIPVVLMEAMAHGIPVVASALSGIPELVEDGQTGLLAPPRDPEKLADALERLYQDPALSVRLSRAGRLKVEREFDLHKSAARLARRFYWTDKT